MVGRRKSVSCVVSDVLNVVFMVGFSKHLSANLKGDEPFHLRGTQLINNKINISSLLYLPIGFGRVCKELREHSAPIPFQQGTAGVK